MGAVVVTHRTPARAERCAASLTAAGASSVVVVDSGSHDGSVQRLRSAGLTVVAEENLGFGRAANAGVAALGAGHEVLVVCNADTEWAPGSLTALASAFDEGDVGAAGPTVRYPDGRLQASARMLPGVVTAVLHAVLGLWWPTNPWTRRYRQLDADPTEPRDVDWLSGCALALRRSAFVEVGGFDPSYFMYMEDVDLAVRLRRAGHRAVTVPDAEVVHEVGASTRQVGSQRVRWHAASIETFVAAHLLPRRWRWALRPPLRLLLAAWVGWATLWARTAGARAGASTTGE